ncbi:MAG: hypothetical protein IH614_06170 [Desulfuromonadales bacterium]|nr:hypothetical protein [Desulfuromonadales bacterium]
MAKDERGIRRGKDSHRVGGKRCRHRRRHRRGWAFLAGIDGIVAVPAAGSVIAAGAILAAIAGAGVGGFIGGIIGALTKGGVPERDARYFAEGVRDGGILVVVHPEAERVEEAKRVMERNGAVTAWNDDGTPRRRSVAGTWGPGQTPEDRANR